MIFFHSLIWHTFTNTNKTLEWDDWIKAQMSYTWPKSYSYRVAGMAAPAPAPTFFNLIPGWFWGGEAGGRGGGGEAAAAAAVAAAAAAATEVHSHPLLGTVYLEVDLEGLGSSKRLSSFGYVPDVYLTNWNTLLNRTWCPPFNLHFSVIYWVLVQISFNERVQS